MDTIIHASEGHVDANDMEEHEQALAIIAGWVDVTDEDTLPARGFHADGTVLEQSRRFTAAGLPSSRAISKVQAGLKALTTNRDLTLARVSVWLGSPDGRPSFLAYPGAPQICFAALNTLSVNFKANEREAVAVYYTPFEAERDFTDRYTGQIFRAASDFNTQGYLGVMRWYPNLELAEAEAENLAWAVGKWQQQVASADRPDVFDGEDVGDDVVDPLSVELF